MANPTVVLVHGAFADPSGFRGLYNELLGEDVTVVAPPNPLRGLSGGDGEYLKAMAGEIDGPVLLAGHSYGGSVITAAGTADNVLDTPTHRAESAISVPDAGLLREPDVSPSVTAAVQSGAISLIF